MRGGHIIVVVFAILLSYINVLRTILRPKHLFSIHRIDIKYFWEQKTGFSGHQTSFVVYMVKNILMELVVVRSNVVILTIAATVAVISLTLGGIAISLAAYTILLQ
jgi:hypothetical protein